MKIKGIKFENNPLFGNSEFSFTDSSGKIMDNIILAGENGCGKTQLLNAIYDFSTLPTTGVQTNEKRTFLIELSLSELSAINELLPQNAKLISPTGEIKIIMDFQEQPGWERLKVQYQSRLSDGSTEEKSIYSYK